MSSININYEGKTESHEMEALPKQSGGGDSANILYSEPDGSSKNVQEKIGELDNEVLELNNNLTATNNNMKKIKTYVGTDGKLHFIDATGADSVLPFKNGVSAIPTIIANGSWTWGTATNTHNVNVTLPTGYEIFIVYAYSYGGESATNPILSSSNLLSYKTTTQSRGGTTIGLYQKDKNSALTVSASASCTSSGASTQDLVIVAVPLS